MFASLLVMLALLFASPAAAEFLIRFDEPLPSMWVRVCDKLEAAHDQAALTILQATQRDPIAGCRQRNLVLTILGEETTIPPHRVMLPELDPSSKESIGSIHRGKARRAQIRWSEQEARFWRVRYKDGKRTITAFAQLPDDPVALKIWPRPGAAGWARTTNGCLVWNENPRDNETIVWDGQCENGKVAGEGTLVWKQGDQEDIETGYFRDGKRHGQSVYVWATGGSFAGEWKNGQRTQGVWVWPDGSRYEGGWRNNRPHGQGTLEQNGEISSGKWIDGCFGKGDDAIAVGRRSSECP